MRKEQIDGDRLFVIHNFLSAEECQHHIDWSEAKGYVDAPITTHMGPVMAKHVRDNERVMIDDRDLAEKWWQRLQPMVPSPLHNWIAVGLNERFRYYRYLPGQRFRPHFDGAFVRNDYERSCLTFMIYLNQECTGGETKFYPTEFEGKLTDDDFCLAIRPETGKAVVFWHHQLHEGSPVLTGTKYVIRSDVMYLNPGE